MTATQWPIQKRCGGQIAVPILPYFLPTRLIAAACNLFTRVEMIMLKTFAASLALALSLTTGAATAATVRESDVGDFSNDLKNPTVIAAGVTAVSGMWSGSNDHDFLSFGFLPAGKQILTLVFEAMPGFGYSYSAGGAIRFKNSPFLWGWDGDTSLAAVDFNYNTAGTPIVRTIELGDDFGGQLWLGLYGTNRNPLTYNISSSAWAAAPVLSPELSPAPDLSPAIVPVPAGLALMLTALGGLGVLALRRRIKLA